MEQALIIGATGRVGREVAVQLCAAGYRVRALTRRPEAAGLPGDIEVVGGDLCAPATLEEGLRGVDAVFLVWVAPAAAAAAALERIAAHAQRIVFLSAPINTPHPFFQQPNPRRDLTLELERLIDRSGLSWTFLRPHMFASNALGWWAPQIREGDVVRWPYLAAPTAPIDERDIAAVAVRALTEDGHRGMEYVLTGPQSLSQREQLALIGRAIGRSLRVEELSADAARQAWASWPPVVVEMLLAAWEAALGQPALVTSTVAEITGAEARRFEDWATDHRAAFQRTG